MPVPYFRFLRLFVGLTLVALVSVSCIRKYDYKNPSADQYAEVLSGQKALVYVGTAFTTSGTAQPEYTWRLTIVPEADDHPDWQTELTDVEFSYERLASRFATLSWANEKTELPPNWISAVGGGFFVVDPGRYKIPEIGFWYRKNDYHSVRINPAFADIELKGGDFINLGRVVIDLNSNEDGSRYAVLKADTSRNLSSIFQKVGIPEELGYKMVDSPIAFNIPRIDYPE